MNKYIDERYAMSLTDIYKHVFDIAETRKGKGERKLLWFRGHEYEYFNLEPSLMRNADYIFNSTQKYGKNHLREDYRFQSFMSRNFDKIENKMPQFEIEWQEVMQHYFTKTRLMDWSESLIVALEFMLESFIKPIVDKDVSEHKRTATPVLWILEPIALNKCVYEALAEKVDISKALVGENADALAKAIKKELQKKKSSDIYFNLDGKSEQNMNAMISLSSLEVIRNSYRGWEDKALQNFEMNPIFYLILRYFSDGIPVEWDKLPPLAIIHPYHSTRIKIQQGVFTVFPHYIPTKEIKEIQKVSKAKVSLGMNYMPQCMPLLHKINIMDPQKIAYELMVTGAKRSNLYPGMQEISQDFENIVQ